MGPWTTDEINRARSVPFVTALNFLGLISRLTEPMSQESPRSEALGYKFPMKDGIFASFYRERSGLTNLFPRSKCPVAAAEQ